MKIHPGEETMKTLIFLAIFSLIFVTCCARSVTKTTAKGFFRVKIVSSGKIFKYGRNEVGIKIADNKGEKVEGAGIEIIPWMPEHGHGTLWPPTVSEEGKGLYRAVIPLVMTGHWQITIKVRKGEVEDSAVFDFPNVTK